MVVSKRNPAHENASATHHSSKNAPGSGSSVRALSQMLSGWPWSSQSGLSFATPAKK